MSCLGHWPTAAFPASTFFGNSSLDLCTYVKSDDASAAAGIPLYYIPLLYSMFGGKVPVPGKSSNNQNEDGVESIDAFGCCTGTTGHGKAQSLHLRMRETETAFLLDVSKWL